MPHATLALNWPTTNEVKTTTSYLCACCCGMRAHLKDGRVRFSDGNSRHPVNHGLIAADNDGHALRAGRSTTSLFSPFPGDGDIIVSAREKRVTVSPMLVGEYALAVARKDVRNIHVYKSEIRRSLLLNLLTTERLLSDRNPRNDADADPVTDQAARFDLRERIEHDSLPQASGHRIEMTDKGAIQ